jgi:TRAP-type mannitol/chloroaromatic compound transport system permease large subunit
LGGHRIWHSNAADFASSIVVAAIGRRLSWTVLRETTQAATRITAMMMFTLICAQAVALAFRGLQGEKTALFGAAPPEVTTGDIYRGVTPFVAMQLLALALVFFFPGIALWLPKAIGW